MDNPEKLDGNIGYTRRRKTKQKHNTICVVHHYMHTDTHNVNKTWALLQTTGGKDEPNIVVSLKKLNTDNAHLVYFRLILVLSWYL
jgi:hypothetical protein